MLGGDLVKDILGFFRPEDLFRILVRHFLDNGRIQDVIVDSERALLIFVVRCLTDWAHFHSLSQSEHGIEAGLHTFQRRLGIEFLLKLFIACLVGEQVRALATDTADDLTYVIKQVTVIHGLNQLDVAEMTGTVDLGALTSLAKAVLVHGAHFTVVDTVRNRVATVVVDLLLLDLRYTKRCNIFLGEYR